MRIATPDRIFAVGEAIRRGWSTERVHELCAIDPWFLDQMAGIVEERDAITAVQPFGLDARQWKRAKRWGFSDAQMAHLWGVPEDEVRSSRLAKGVRPTYKTVDTCAAEFEADTPYHYSTWEDETEVRPSDRPKVIILGSGPNRIGQGIEFDYGCVHASFALGDAGFETVMVNCNPETVSTDYDTSDRLYFEPLTIEDTLAVIDAESADGEVAGVIVSLGGQTPLKLADSLPPDLVAGTSPASIDLAEDRDRWNALCDRLGIAQPPGGTAVTVADALQVADSVGYPALVRPSYVLGGRAMEIVYDPDGLTATMTHLATQAGLGREGGLSASRPVLIDRFLEDAVEVDVDAIRDSTGDVLIGGIMEHVEEAGVHSGDSACVIPPVTLDAASIATIEAHTRRIADALDVVGLINVQFAVQRTADGAGEVFVIEANPRASRTVPFVAKATGVALVKVAARVMLGASLVELRGEGVLREPVEGDHVAVKEAVLPFSRFPDADAVLGPEMRSTGEVMGIDRTAGLAFAKAQLAAGDRMPTSGTVFLSLADRDKATGARAAERFVAMGFALVATEGTADFLSDQGIEVGEVLGKLSGGSGPTERRTAVDLIAAGEIDLVVNSPRGRGPRADGAYIRSAAGTHQIPLLTTASAALAAANGIADTLAHEPVVRSLQEYHRGRDPGAERPIVTIPEGVDMSVTVGSVELPNPVMCASGTAGHGTELAPYLDLPVLGAFVVKSLSAEPWAGNPGPRLHPTPAGMINSVGLQGPGVDGWLAGGCRELLDAGVRRIVVSIWGRSVEEYRSAAERLAGAAPGGGRRRGQPELPESRCGAAPVRPRCHPGVGGDRGHGGLRSTAMGQAQSQHRSAGRGGGGRS